MIAAEHHDALAGRLGVALGHALELAEGLEADGFPRDPRVLPIESLICQAAVEGRWGEVVTGLLACSTWEPAIYLDAWRTMAAAVVEVLGGSANGGPVPISPGIRGRRWVSAHGSAVELPSGAIRVQIPDGARRNLAVTLPLVAGGRV